MSATKSAGERRLIELEKFIRKRLETIVGNDILEDFLTPEAMKVWSRAFTDQTYSADNYELYEIIGDSAIGLAFYDIIRETFPDVNQPKIYSTLKEFYLSETSFRDFAIEAGFLRFLRAASLVKQSSEMKSKIAEDLWESYHGALKELGDKIGLERYYMGVGYQCVKNSMVEVMNTKEIDKDRGAGAFKNQLNEIATVLRIQIINVNYVIATEHKVGFAYLLRRNVFIEQLKRFGKTEEEIDQIMKNVSEYSNDKILKMPAVAKNAKGVRNDDIVIGLGKGETKEEAQDNAASQAVKDFRNVYGLADVYLDGIRAEQLDEHLKGKGEIKEAYDNIQKVYSDIKISSRTFSNVSLYILTGVKEGKTHVITIIKFDKGERFDKIQGDLYLEASRLIDRKK